MNFSRKLTIEQNITAVLETCFAGFKDELINEAAKSILRLIDNQGCPPAFDANLCESCVHSNSIAGVAGQITEYNDTCDEWAEQTERSSE